MRIVAVTIFLTMLGVTTARADVLDLLRGPLPLMGQPSTATGVSTYDTYDLTKGRTVAAQFPFDPSDMVSSDFYDLALNFYVTNYRSGDAFWLSAARSVATAWRDSINNQNIPKYLAGDYSVGPTIPPPRGMATLGLAIFAAETGDVGARTVVNNHARLVEEAFGMAWSDAREAAYSLIALVASTLLGDDHSASAREMLDVILANQKPDGHWEDTSTSGLVPPNPDGSPQVFVLNYMNGLLMEALAFYDRALDDTRVLPAIQRCVDWTWTTQWLDGAGAFQYGNINSGSITTAPAPDLNGLMLPGWGYAFSRTGITAYRDQGDRIFAGLVATIPSLTWDEKHFAQVYRSSAQYLGFTAGGFATPVPTPTPKPTATTKPTPTAKATATIKPTPTPKPPKGATPTPTP